MAIIGVLSTLVQCSTENFDKGMEKVNSTAGKTRAAIASQSAGISDALNSMGNLSGLGGAVSGAVGRVVTALANIKTVVAGVSNAFTGAAAQIASPFIAAASLIENVFMATAKAVAIGLIAGITSVIVSQIPAVIGGIASLAIAAVTTLGKAWLAVVTPFVSFVFGLVSQAASAMAGVAKAAFEGLSTVIFGTAGNAATFLGGLLANIPTGGILILVGAIVVAGTALVAATVGMGAFAAFSAVPAAFAGGFGLLTTAVSGLLPVLAGVGTVMGTIAASLVSFGFGVGVFFAVGAAAIGAAGGLWKMASAGADAIKEISLLSRELGIATQAMAALALGGLDPGAMTHALIHMQRGIEDMSAHAAGALAKINLNPQQLRGMEADQQLRMIADGFAGLTQQGDRASVAMALFGRSGITMMDTLSRGSAGFDALTARAQRFGLEFTATQAQAIRSANLEWAGFGQAIEGINRRAAVLFAPLWEWIGKIGGQVGEWLVRKFEAFAAVAQAALPDIQAAAMNLWNSMQAGIGGVMDMVKAFGKTWGLTWDSVEDVALTALATVIVAFRDLPATWKMVSALIDLGWLKLMKGLAEPVSNAMGLIVGIWKSLPEIWSIATNAMDLTWLKFLKGMKDGFVETFKFIAQATTLGAVGAVAKWAADQVLGDPAADAARAAQERARAAMAAAAGDPANAALAAAAQNAINEAVATAANAGLNERIAAAQLAVQNGVGNIQQNIRDAQARFRGDWFPGIDGQIKALTTTLSNSWGLAGDKVTEMVDAWRANMRLAQKEAAKTADQLAIVGGMSKAISGHDVALAGGEKAFSLLYGGRGTQDYYQQALLAEAKKENGYMERVTRLLGQAPVIRKANF